MTKLKHYFELMTRARSNEGKNLPLILMAVKMTRWIIKCRGGLSYFFMLNLHKKENKISQFLTPAEFFHHHDALNPMYYRVILEDKYVFDRFMSSYNFPVAEMKAILQNDTITWISEGFSEPIENILNYDQDCYCKLHTKWGGLDVYKVSIHNKEITINNIPSNLLHFKQIIAKGLFVLQKTVVQHPELNRLNSSCVNTIRMITIHDGKKPNNFLNFIRLGIGTSIVDNISHGGIGCAIHEDGTLYDNASDLFGNNIRIKTHPTTGVEFRDFRIPYYKQALDLVIKMHGSLHCFFIIGWDIAITNSGPVVIEGNPLGDLVYEQALLGGIRRQFLEYAHSYRKGRSTFLGENKAR